MKNFCTRPEPLPADVSVAPVLLRLADVELRRDDKVILSDVNLSIRRGDFVAVTGPNGGGKTTLLRIILGLLRPSAGSVCYLQHGLRIGYLPQKSRIDASYPISVSEVVASGLLGVKDLSAAERARRVAEAIEQVELVSHAAKPIGALSGGQQQRALLARAIIAGPQVLVLDEPLSYLDKHFEQKMYAIIGAMAKSTTIILVSHEIDTIATMANRHLIVDHTVSECPSARHFARIALCQ